MHRHCLPRGYYTHGSSLKWLALQVLTGVMASELGPQAGYRTRTAASAAVHDYDGYVPGGVQGAQGAQGCPGVPRGAVYSHARTSGGQCRAWTQVEPLDGSFVDSGFCTFPETRKITFG